MVILNDNTVLNKFSSQPPRHPRDYALTCSKSYYSSYIPNLVILENNGRSANFYSKLPSHYVTILVRDLCRFIST